MLNFSNDILLFREQKSKVVSDFMSFVQDNKVDILTRLDYWETYAEELLPVGSWASDAPEWLLDNWDVSRNALVPFTDLAENLDEEHVEFDHSTGKIKSISRDGVAMLSEVFATGLAGTHYDW